MKRIISVLIVLTLCLSICPTRAFAEGKTGSYNYAHGDHSDYTALTDSSSTITLQPGKYYLADLTTQKDIEIPEGAEVEICLNGYTLTMNGQGTTSILGPSGTAIHSALSDDQGVTLTIENGNIIQSGIRINKGPAKLTNVTMQFDKDNH